MDKDKIEMKTIMESAAVAEYLTQLAKGFESGTIVVEKDGESLTLIPAETAEVEVEARVKKDKARFSLEVTWRTAASMDEAASLKISAETSDAAKAAKCGDKLCDAKPCDKSAAPKSVEKPAEKPMGKATEKPMDKTMEKKDEPKVAAPAAPAQQAKPVTPATHTGTAGTAGKTPAK